MKKQIYEFNNQSMSDARIDQDNKVIQGVSIMSTNLSQNGRIYQPKSLHSLVNLINKEQSKCFLNHESTTKKGMTDSVRDLRDYVGNFSNASTDGKGIVKADLRCVSQHWPLISDLAENSARCGMSVAISALTSKRDKQEVVEDIGKVYSIDAVSSPAMTSRILESIQKNHGQIDLDEATKKFLGEKEVDKETIEKFLKYKKGNKSC